jgi:hypothetical protein
MPSKETPQWVHFTPEDTEYRLIMFEGGAGRQEIELNRTEYKHLKSVLAKERGYVLRDDDPAPTSTTLEEETRHVPNGTWSGFLRSALNGDVAAMRCFVRLEIDHGSHEDQEPENLGGETGSRQAIRTRLPEEQPRERTRSNHADYSSGGPFGARRRPPIRGIGSCAPGIPVRGG